MDIGPNTTIIGSTGITSVVKIGAIIGTDIMTTTNIVTRTATNL